MTKKKKTSKNTPSATRGCREKKQVDIVEIAKKKRRLALMEKVQRGSALTAGELAELKKFEGKTDLSVTSVSSLERVASAFDVSLRTVQRWVAQGMPQKEGGEYDLLAIQAWRLSKADQNPGDTEGWELTYRKYKALLAEIEYQKRIGDLIPKAEVVAGMIDRITAVKMQFLALPQRIAPQLEGLDVNQREELLRDRLEEIIQEFADGKH